MRAPILLDHSSVERFVAGGRLALSARTHPVAGDDQLPLPAVTVDLTAWPMSAA